jgi:hypothetical protein
MASLVRASPDLFPDVRCASWFTKFQTAFALSLETVIPKVVAFLRMLLLVRAEVKRNISMDSIFMPWVRCGGIVAAS